MKKITAISFTPKYDALEDRIRISINYDDLNNRIDFMMTRSFMLKLFPVLDEYMLKYYGIETGIQATNSVVTSDSKNDKNISVPTTSVTDGSNLELYKQQDELLLEVKFSYVKDTTSSIIQFISKNSNASARLNSADLKQVFTIIKSTIPSFSWGVSQSF